MFGNGSMALVNAETLLPSASWWELRQHFSGVWHKWRTKISKNGVLRWFEHWGCRKIAFTWLAFRSTLVALGLDSDQKRAYIHMIRQLQLSSWWCKGTPQCCCDRSVKRKPGEQLHYLPVKRFAQLEAWGQASFQRRVEQESSIKAHGCPFGKESFGFRIESRDLSESSWVKPVFLRRLCSG
ncbi:hypothetical protein F2Q70_00042962 [Brassica cretica]|uniref:Uncharacterized protein n=1 Tax=Brassica cretica TaxID=69181 RepID=A0A8S9KIG6_BRACR|nr:hypothetical protein F2Q70_00042962 [Brassica cretica]KAF3519194.1 hypothetical protein DY000_02059615 [Brassica cretica]